MKRNMIKFSAVMGALVVIRQQLDMVSHTCDSDDDIKNDCKAGNEFCDYLEGKADELFRNGPPVELEAQVRTMSLEEMVSGDPVDLKGIGAEPELEGEDTQNPVDLEEPPILNDEEKNVLNSGTEEPTA